MPKIIKDSIEYWGLADEILQLRSPYCFKQFNIKRNLVLPDSKQMIKKILKNSTELIVKETRLVKTLQGISGEGQVLTGKKLIVEGELLQRIDYIADMPSQAVHTVYFNIPYASHIIIPRDLRTDLPVIVTGHIQDMSMELFDCRSLLYTALILLVAEY